MDGNKGMKSKLPIGSGIWTHPILLDSKISDDGERRICKFPLKDIYRTSPMSQRYLLKPQKALGDK